LIDVLQSESFQQGDVFTDFIEVHFPDWKPEFKDADIARIAFIVDEMNAARRKNSVSNATNEIPSPFFTLGNWRMAK
jgi:hypothetical protein